MKFRNGGRGVRQICFECGGEALYQHHVVPRSLGGRKTVWLCSLCHGRAHGRDDGFRSTGALTAVALRKRKMAMEKTGGTLPFGYSLVGASRLQPKKEEVETIKLMQELRQQGLTLREIVAELEQRGIKTKTGKTKWHPQVVRQVLELWGS